MKIFIVMLLSVARTFIAYDYGYCKEFHDNSVTYPNFNCLSNIELTLSITFSGTFKNKPNIILYVSYYDMAQGYRLSLGAIEYTYFQVILKCPSYISGVYFFWSATDDKRITVINNFNQDVTTFTTNTYSFPHTNIYATKAYAGMISFYSNGPFKQKIEITNLNQTHVDVKLTKSTNLKSYGFFVVIGTEDAFSLPTSATTLNNPNSGSSPIYKSPTLTVSKTNGVLIFVSIIYFDWAQTSENIRIRTFYTLTDTQYQFNLTLWSNTEYNIFSFNITTFNFQNYKVAVPFQCKKMKISKKYVTNLDSNTIKIYHKEPNQYYYAGDQKPLVYNPDTLTFTISIFIQCRQSNKKYSVKVLKCFSCNKQFYTSTFYCYGSINLIQQDIYYTQTDIVYQKLLVSVTSTSIQITQQAVTTSDAILLSIELI